MDASRTGIAGGNARVPLLQRILNRVFRCAHRHLGLPITLRGESFALCLDCGARVAYDLQLFGGHAHPKKDAGSSANSHPAAPAKEQPAPAKAQAVAAPKAPAAEPAKAKADDSGKRSHRRPHRSRVNRKAENVPGSKPNGWLHLSRGTSAAAFRMTLLWVSLSGSLYGSGHQWPLASLRDAADTALTGVQGRSEQGVIFIRGPDVRAGPGLANEEPRTKYPVISGHTCNRVVRS